MVDPGASLEHAWSLFTRARKGTGGLGSELQLRLLGAPHGAPSASKPKPNMAGGCCKMIGGNLVWLELSARCCMTGRLRLNVVTACLDSRMAAAQRLMVFGDTIEIVCSCLVLVDSSARRCQQV